MPYGRDKLVLALALPPSPPGFLPSGKNQEAPKKFPTKKEFEKILFKAAFELGMPDPNQNPEEALDWLLKKQRERKLTIQEQELLEWLIKLLEGDISSSIAKYLNKYENAPLGKEIGRGNFKSVYEILDEPDLVMGKQHLDEPLNFENLDDGIMLLEEIKKYGLPVVEILGKTRHRGIPAIIMKKYEIGSKSIVRARNFKPRIIGDSEFLNAQSIRDLKRIRQIIQIERLHISDLQFLIDKNGRVVIADPLSFKSNAGEEQLQKGLNIIDKLIEVASK